MTPNVSPGALSGRTVAVPESRELDLFASMLERQGATVLRCPLVAILDVADRAPVEAWLRRLAGGGLDDLILFTGEGLRRLRSVAERAGIEREVAAALGRVRTIVRGPKPVKALREMGLAPGVVAAEPTTAGVLASLEALSLAGRRVGLQAYPGQGEEVDDALRGRGAAVDRVLPYRYASDEQDARVLDLIEALAAGAVDLIAFTSRPQVGRLRDVANRHGRTERLAEGMRRARIAAIGPVCAEAVTAAGWPVAVAPEASFHLKPMVAAMAGLFRS